MIHSENQIEDRTSLSNNQFQDQLINHTLILCATLGAINFSISMLRAWKIGWIFRDSLFLVIVISVLLVAFYRAKLNVHAKAIIIISFCLLCAAIGIYNLNMLAGAIFFLPLSSIIFALIYSKRAVIGYGVFLVAFLCFMGVGFSSGYIHLRISPSPDFLMTNYFHWLVYSLTFGLFYLIACMTVLKYRKIHQELLMNNKLKHDKLEKSNKDLQKALEEIKTLRGILPICTYCKKIKDDKGYWEKLESYISNHTQAEFSHGICPECQKRIFKDIET